MSSLNADNIYCQHICLDNFLDNSIFESFVALNGDDIYDIEPWYRGFKGENKNGVSKGVYKRLTNTKVDVTELPIGYWTEDFKTYLESYIWKNIPRY